ncbi:MAG: amino acid permease [Lentimicrobiaceae bacterium]|nr:amino acid permease [Lentimicrobiaceae bacterium]
MAKSKKFGTFGGVFTPSILTILGVIMYMRLPMIAGEAGLFGTLGIIFIAHLISITTGLSVSSIATDKKVKEGGTYYIISRSLGLPIGGTLGLALFVGLSFSVSLYLIGFSESFLGYLNLPMDIYHIRITGTIILVVVTIITFISTSLAIKAQYLIMAAIALSLLSILFGNHDMAPATPNLFGNGSGVPLMVLFGIFFPAVTGFEAGVSMSGDLKDAKKSIPLGTISAIAIGLVVYIILAFFFAYTVDGNMLATDSKALFKIALIPELVIAGIWGATLSSALGSILAAPRILQSTAIDKITPRIFSIGTGAAKEPRNALLLTFAIAEMGILIGELNVIARIVSIFFITTYGFLNLSAAFESITSADFRPSFKTPAWVSIIGSLACILVMIQLDFPAMIGAVVILSLLFLTIKRRQLVLETGDTWSSVWLTVVKAGILRLNKSSIHHRNWRPNIILFSGAEENRPYLLELVKAFSGRLGMFTAFEMIKTDKDNLRKDVRLLSSANHQDGFQIHQHTCLDIYDGMNEISRMYGFSGIEPNTILMGWSKDLKNKSNFLQLINNYRKSNFNTIYLNYNHLKKTGNKKTIDVWWNGKGSNLTFTIFLLRHFTSSGEWKDAHIRLLIINNQHITTEYIYKNIQEILNKYRISAEIKVINNSIDTLPDNEIICRESISTDITFISLSEDQYLHINQTYDDVNLIAQTLGTFFLIHSSDSFEEFDIYREATIIPGENNIQTYKTDKELPNLIPSKYSIINENIEKTDINGQKVLTLFYEKTFAPVYAEILKLAEELQSASLTVFAQLNKPALTENSYKKNKTIIRLKNDYFYKTNRIITELASIRLDILQQKLGQGIEWYIDRLEHDIQKYPLYLEIPYNKQELKIKTNDSVRMRWFKLRKRIMHPFSGKTIPGNIRYYEIANYYLRNNRHYFLSAFLDKFKKDLFTQLSAGKTYIITIDHMLESLLAKPFSTEEIANIIKTSEKENALKAEQLKSAIMERGELTRNRLMFEFRKNLQLMCNDMSKADINYRIRRKHRNRKYYEKLKIGNAQFASEWHTDTLHQLNRIYMDILLQSLKSRIKDKLNDLSLNISLQLDNNLRNDLQTIRLNLEKSGSNPELVPPLSLGISSFDENVTFMVDFDRLGEEIVKLSESLPENLTIPYYDHLQETKNSELNTIDVPLRKISRFYIESRFIGNTHDRLEKEATKLKSAIFVIQDLLNLTRFNLDNIQIDSEDRASLMAPVISDAIKNIQKEEQAIIQIKNSISEIIHHSLDEVFEHLSVYKMPVTVSEYSRFIRAHQSKIVRKTFSNYLHFMGKSMTHLIAWGFYSRSEGILLTKKIIENENVSSVNQKILAFVENVSPEQKILNKLPQYYRNLFSCQSSINEDFWIKREKDEALFKTALRRYQTGNYGGIIIIGEQNSGKTAFCRNITGKLFRKEKAFHLFPLQEGSSIINDFLNELQKVTNIQGSLSEIIENLPAESTIIIHDLELWWNRSESGWETVEFIAKTINQYSSKVLFVVNTNPHAFNLMNKVINLQNEFIQVIPLMPFDSRDLQEMIMRRHRSSGLRFKIGSHEEEQLSEIRAARLFNKYFDYSEGNPGTALLGWMSNIQKINDQTILIQQPHIPEIRVLSEMNDDWKTLLVQIIIHKRLTRNRIAGIFHSDEAKSDEIINSLWRTGLIEQRQKDIFVINHYIEPHLLKVFKAEHLL